MHFSSWPAPSYSLLYTSRTPWHVYKSHPIFAYYQHLRLLATNYCVCFCSSWNFRCAPQRHDLICAWHTSTLLTYHTFRQQPTKHSPPLYLIFRQSQQHTAIANIPSCIHPIAHLFQLHVCMHARSGVSFSSLPSKPLATTPGPRFQAPCISHSAAASPHTCGSVGKTWGCSNLLTWGQGQGWVHS
jgi:hypothetical protein